MGGRLQPNTWRARQVAGEWRIVRIDADGVIVETSPMRYGSQRYAGRDAAVWNQEERRQS